MSRRAYAEQSAERHFWELMYMVRSSGRFVDSIDIERAIAEGHDTVGKVLKYFGLTPIGAGK